MIIPIQPIKWKEFIENLEQLDPWLDELGIEQKHKSDRLHKAISLLKEADEKRRLEPHQDLRQIYPDFYLVLAEMIELSDTMQAFRNDLTNILREKVKVILSGPLSPRDENPQNSHARNIGFELALASEWRLQGLEARLKEPDIRVQLDGHPFLVACKRPFSKAQIEENVRSAAAQIRKQPSRSNEWAIIAVSVSRILSKGTMIYRAPTEQALEKLGDEIENLLNDSTPRWSRASFDSRVKAVVFHCGITAIIEDRSLWSRVAYCVFHPIGREGPIFQHIRKGLESLYGPSDNLLSRG